MICRLWQWKLPILTMNMMKMIMMIFAAKYDKQGSPLKCAALKRVIWGYPALRLLTLERAKMMMMVRMMTMVMMIKMIMTIIWQYLPLLMLPLHPQADQGVKSLCNFPENNFQKKISKIWTDFIHFFCVGKPLREMQGIFGNAPQSREPRGCRPLEQTRHISQIWENLKELLEVQVLLRQTLTSNLSPDFARLTSFSWTLTSLPEQPT